MKKGRLFLSVMLSVCLLFGQLPAALAEESLEEQLERINNQAYEQQQKIEAAQEKVDLVTEQMAQINEQVRKARQSYDAVKKELTATEKGIAENEAQLKIEEQKLAIKNRVLCTRVRNIYIHGRLNYLEVLLGAKDFSDFISRMDMFKRIIEQDVRLLQQIVEERAAVLARQKELEKEKRLQEKLVAQADAEQQEILTRQADKQRLLDKLETDRDLSRQAYEEMMEASRNIEELIRSRSGSSGSEFPPSASGSGSMTWPFYGEITSAFGWRTHPVFGDARFHSGIDISGDYGLPVVAAASGRVSYADWIEGYGYAVMIDHGGGVETLYGHNEELCVSEGQYVEQGQMIAFCGSTGYSTGPHCHFEVRENGEPVDPLNYL